MTLSTSSGASIQVPNFSNLQPGLSNTTFVTIDAALEAAEFIGQVIWADGGSHTINTSGSSSIGWREATQTWANAGSSLKVGIASVDTSNGPPARAANSTGTITFNVSKSITGGAGLSASAWNEHVPDSGTDTIATGDFRAVCMQLVTRGGTDIVRPQFSTVQTGINLGLPAFTSYTSSAFAEVSATSIGGVLFTASDGTLGWLEGSAPFNTLLSTAWNNTSTTKEYGNFLQFPYPVSIKGISALMLAAADFSLNLYTAPLTAPSLAATAAIDANVIGAAGALREVRGLFATPYQLAANTPCAAILQPTSSTNITLNGRTFNASAHHAIHELGTNCYAVNRNTVSGATAFTAQNSNKDLIHISLLLNGFDDASGVGGIPLSRVRLGM